MHHYTLLLEMSQTAYILAGISYYIVSVIIIILLV